MKMWILLLCAAVSSMDEYNPYDVKSTDVVEPEPVKHPVAKKCVKFMFCAGCVYVMCQLYCTYTQPDAYCGEQSSEIQQAKSIALIEAAKKYFVCGGGAAIPVCTLTNNVWKKCKDFYKLAYDKSKSSEETLDLNCNLLEIKECFMDCIDLDPKDVEECNFYYTRKNRLLKIKNKEDAKWNSEKLSEHLRLNAPQLHLYKQIGEQFVGVANGKYINLKELENALSTGKKGLGHSFKLKIENGKVEHVFQTKDELDAILNPLKIDSSNKGEELDRQTGDGKPTASNKENEVSKPTTKNKDNERKQSDKGKQKKDSTSATTVKANK